MCNLCYGVDRPVEYAYETRHRFPDRRIFLSGEIIHNGDVNAHLRQMDVIVLPSAAADPAVRYADIKPHDVIILPAFGVTADEMAFLSASGCVLVDTTCGSVLNVWKMVHRLARDGFTVVIHGKRAHEETRATASQALTHPGGRFLCLRDVTEADAVCAFLRGQLTAAALRARFATASSPRFDPDRDLERIGLANQTTMLMSESLEIQERLRAAMRDRFGEAALPDRFRAFDTICSATQDRQDAVRAMLEAGGLDIMVRRSRAARSGGSTAAAGPGARVARPLVHARHAASRAWTDRGEPLHGNIAHLSSPPVGESEGRSPPRD